MHITRWPELLIGKNSVKPCISPSIIAFINIRLVYYKYRSNEAGEMMGSIAVTKFSVNKFCASSSKIYIANRTIKESEQSVIFTLAFI